MPPPERETVEREIHDLVTNHLSELARLLQVNNSTTSNAFNPYRDDKNNPVYHFLLHLWAFDIIKPGLSDDILAIVARERSTWNPSASVNVCPAKLTKKVGTELFQAVEAEILGKPWEEQIKEWSDVERAANEKKQKVIETRNARYFGEVDMSVRNGLKPVVEKYKARA